MYFKHFVGLITFKRCCWNKLLTAKATCWDTLSCTMIIFSFLKFFVVMDGFSANDLFQASAFIKDYNGKRATGFLQLSLVCNMCQCFVWISFKFGNARLYVTDKGMHCLSCFSWWSKCFRLSWSTFWICCMTSFLHPLLTNCSISFLEWLW